MTQRWEEFIAWNTASISGYAPEAFETAQLPSLRDGQKLQSTHNFEAPLAEPLEAYLSRDKRPLPIAADREGYHPGQDVEYWTAGLDDYLKLRGALNKHAPQARRLFELGCASGRVLRHFIAQEPTTWDLWGADLNFRNVSWVSTFLPEVKIVQNSALPHLPIEDNFVDAVCAFSVFSHIETFELAWLAEIRRILRPGGVAYLTIMSDKTWDRIRNWEGNAITATLRRIPGFNEACLNDPMPAERIAFRGAADRTNTANVFISQDYVHRVWGRYLEVLEIRTLDHYYSQDVVVLRKPG